MLKALTFLGLGPKDGYQETTYHKVDDKTANCKTHLFTKAVAEIYQPNKTILFVTPEVEKDEKGYLRYLKGKLRDEFDTVSIPNGDSEMKLWDIFNACENAVEEGDKIILDITHAFRSIPLLIFIVAAYLRQVKSVELEHIIYGAFEARNPDTNETPIFDLTPFVKLLDWMNAVNVFQNYGDARPIAKLDVQEDIATALTTLSDALLTNRTLEAQEAAMNFNGLQFVDSQQPPFQMLVQQLQQSYNSMAAYKPSKNPKTSLKAQYQQIKWYMENQHYLQAITLMREWLISYRCQQDLNGHWLTDSKRKKAERELGELKKQQDSQMAQQLSSLVSTTDDSLNKLWKDCAEIRNDLAHCGMQHQADSATQAIKKIKKLFNKFKEYYKAIDWNNLNSV